MNIELLSLKNCEIDLKSIFRHKIDKLPELSHREFSSSTFKLLCEVPKVSKSATSSRTSSPSTLPTSSSIFTLKLWSSLKRFLLKLALEIILYRIIPGLGSTSSRKSETSVLSPREPRDRQLRLK